MLKELRPAITFAIVLTAITGLVYPLGMTGLAEWLFPAKAEGSLIVRDGKLVGSMLIGQPFTSDRYFHGRPSATTGADPNDPSKTAAVPYNAANSGGANLGPTNKALVERVQGDIERIKTEDGSEKVPPADLLTTSASGLDPDISPEGALFQVPRVAKSRGLTEERVRQLVTEHEQGRMLGFLGEPRVNVLALNLALDRLSP